jgi:uncharacterized RDD family membrane protein YckC
MFCPSCGSEMNATTCPSCAASRVGGQAQSLHGLTLAGWWLRVFASLVDWILLAVLAFVLGVVFGYAIGAGLYIIANASYLIVLLSRPRGQTIGNMVAGTCVRSNGGGGALTVQQAAIRWAAVGLPGILVSVIRGFGWFVFLYLIVDILFPLLDQQRQTIHDKAANTIMVVAKRN